MTYTLDNKTINIPDSEIEKSMQVLELTKEEAVQLWLEDNDYLTNEELEELDAKAKKVKINHGAGTTKPRKKSDKPRVVKVSDEKKTLFSEILADLEDVFKNDVQVLKENKLIEVKIGEKVFKIDIIEQRTPKK